MSHHFTSYLLLDDKTFEFKLLQPLPLLFFLAFGKIEDLVLANSNLLIRPPKSRQVQELFFVINFVLQEG